MYVYDLGAIEEKSLRKPVSKEPDSSQSALCVEMNERAGAGRTAEPVLRDKMLRLERETGKYSFSPSS